MRWRDLAVAAAILPAALGSGAIAERGHPTFLVGPAGWALERFAGDVTILRASLAPPGRAEDPAPAGLFLLSCEGTERRWRLDFPSSLPISLPGLLPVAGGEAPVMLVRLVRAADERASQGSAGATDYRIARVRLRGRSLLVAEPEGTDAMLRWLARTLATGPVRIDLVIRPWAARALLAPVTIVLVPQLRPADRATLIAFVVACGDGSDGRPGARGTPP